MTPQYIPRTIYTEEHELFRQAVKDFYQKEIVPYHDQWEEDKQISREAWEKAGQMGFLCTGMPEEYGGAGLDFRYSAILIEELIKTGCDGPGFGLHSDIVAPYILHLGTEEQKKEWLPKMATAEVISAIAMTDPSAGSDLQGIKTTAVKEGDHYIVNGSKTFITNGYMCDMAIVVAKTDPEKGAHGTSLLLMDTNMEGFTKGKPLKKIGMHAQDTSELFFDNVKVPVSNLLGKENEGFYYLMQELPQERLLVGIISLELAVATLEHTLKYTSERQAFGRSINKFQHNSFKLAEMYSKVQQGRVFIDKCIELHVEGKLEIPTAAMAKYAMSDMACEVTDECLQLHGGYGYMYEYFVARAWTDARVQKIYAGSNEIMKELIARSIIV
ncbi:MAG: acyl-CoA dehydrogenase [Flavobacteriales bacterium]|nr:MAG: acyl-CoA dehydrogenase [Flavobacteriales bacterium]